MFWPQQSPWKLLGFWRMENKFGLIFLILKDYTCIRKIYRSNMCFVGHGLRTGNFCGNCLNTRRISSPSYNWNSASCFTIKEIELWRTLCPNRIFADGSFCCFLSQVKAGLNEASGCYEIRSETPTSKNNQVFISYGPHDNGRLLLEYGFIVPNNQHNTVSVEMGEADMNSGKFELNFR